MPASVNAYVTYNSTVRLTLQNVRYGNVQPLPIKTYDSNHSAQARAQNKYSHTAYAH